MAKKRSKPELDWEKARDVVRRHRPRLRRRKGVVDVKVTHRFDERGKPTGLPQITIEVAAKIPKEKLRSNQVLPDKIDGLPVSVVDIRGHIPSLQAAAVAPAVGPVTAAVTIGPGSKITPSAGGVPVNGIDFFGSVSAVVFSAGKKFLLTCSHVLSKNGVPLLDGEVSVLDDGSSSATPIGATTEPNPVRGHDSIHDCVIITPSIPQDQVQYLINDPFIPGNMLQPEPDGHYRSARLTSDDKDKTRVFHVGAVSPGAVGIVSDVDGPLDASGSVPATPITTGLIVIRPESGASFSQSGDSGALVLTVNDMKVVGMVIGIQTKTGFTVACHFEDVEKFFNKNSFPMSL